MCLFQRKTNIFVKKFEKQSDTWSALGSSPQKFISLGHKQWPAVVGSLYWSWTFSQLVYFMGQSCEKSLISVEQTKLVSNLKISVYFHHHGRHSACVLQERCFTPPSLAAFPCPLPRTAVCPWEGSWPQWGSSTWPGRAAWTAAPLDGCLMAASATLWRSCGPNVQRSGRESTLSRPTAPLTTPPPSLMPTATEVESRVFYDGLEMCATFCYSVISLDKLN